MFSVGINVRYVPTADINHHRFSVTALIRLVQLGGPLKSSLNTLALAR